MNNTAMSTAQDSQPETVKDNNAFGKVLVKTGLWLIKLYQATSIWRTPRCRYIPSCSTYAELALTQHGASKGLWLALKRLLRCNPFGSYGYDPVPD